MNLADLVASSMQEIINSDEHKKLFKKEASAAKKVCCPDCKKCGAKCVCKGKCKSCKDCEKPAVKKEVKKPEVKKPTTKKKASLSCCECSNECLSNCPCVKSSSGQCQSKDCSVCAVALNKKTSLDIVALLLKASELQDGLGFTKSSLLTGAIAKRAIADMVRLAGRSDDVAAEIAKTHPGIFDDVDVEEDAFEGVGGDDEGEIGVEELLAQINEGAEGEGEIGDQVIVDDDGNTDLSGLRDEALMGARDTDRPSDDGGNTDIDELISNYDVGGQTNTIIPSHDDENSVYDMQIAAAINYLDNFVKNSEKSSEDIDDDLVGADVEEAERAMRATNFDDDELGLIEDDGDDEWGQYRGQITPEQAAELLEEDEAYEDEEARAEAIREFDARNRKSINRWKFDNELNEGGEILEGGTEPEDEQLGIEEEYKDPLVTIYDTGDDVGDDFGEFDPSTGTFTPKSKF